MTVTEMASIRVWHFKLISNKSDEIASNSAILDAILEIMKNFFTSTSAS
jgi:hypothetical protein